MTTHSARFLAVAALLLLPVAAPAQTTVQTTGTSHPEALDDTIVSTEASPHYAKPSAKPSPAVAMPAVAPPAAPQLQTRPVANPATATMTPAPFDDNDVDSGVVTSVAGGPNDLPIGTRLVAQLNNTLSTKGTRSGEPFAAELTQPVMHDGRILLPVGTVIEGRVTQIHGGRRIRGASAIRLQPDRIILPDSRSFRLDAEVVGLDHVGSSRVNREGVIVDSSNGKVALGAAGLTTVTGLVTGAMIGGGVGAVVGAGVGAGLGTYWWLCQERQQTLPTGTEIVFSLDDVLTLRPAPAAQAVTAASF